MQIYSISPIDFVLKNSMRYVLHEKQKFIGYNYFYKYSFAKNPKILTLESELPRHMRSATIGLSAKPQQKT